MKAIKKNTNNRQKFTFPPQEELERVIKKFSDPNCKEINIGLMPDASELDKTKYDICQSIAQPKRANCWLCNFYCILSVGLFCFYWTKKKKNIIDAKTKKSSTNSKNS